MVSAVHTQTMRTVPLPERFRAARRLADVSLTQAARELGTSRSTLVRAERGERTIPHPWVLWAKTHWQPPEGVRHPLEDD